MIQILRGDCRDVLKTLAADSLDGSVTDSPYGLSEHSAEDVAACLRAWLAGEAYEHGKAGFMGKKWDSFVPGPDMWRELYRVLKPGAHALVFAGTRTAGMLEVALRLAGFEIRDSIEAGGFVSAARLTWRYGSGFPKSLDVGKAIDKARSTGKHDAYRVTAWVRARCAELGITGSQLNAAAGVASMASHWLTDKSQPLIPTLEQWEKLEPLLGAPPEWMRPLLLPARKPGDSWEQREVIGTAVVPAGHAFAGPTYGNDSSAVTVDVTAPATEAAKTWDGWGTALKPSYEPIIVARKPLADTVAANVLKHGTGAINVDGCRVATTDEISTHSRGDGYDGPAFHRMNPKPTRVQPGQALGRWPPNTLLVHLPECERSGTREVASDAHWPSDRGAGSQVAGPSGHAGQSGLPERSPKTEAVATYRCAPGCPVAAIDAQSGPAGAAAQATGGTRSGASTSRARNRYGGAPEEAPFYADAGGASRFSPNFEYSELDVPFLYCAKAARKEREAGCEELPARTGAAAVDREEGSDGLKSPRAGAGRTASEVRNHHPTVKPVALLRWLLRLVVPPGGTVIDPFAGSGSTLVAVVYEGVSGVGIELDQDAAGEPAGYVAIAEARVAHAQAEAKGDPEPPRSPERALPERGTSKPPGTAFLARLLS